MIQSTRYKKGNPVMYNGVQMFVYMGSQHPKYILSEIEDLNEVTSDKLHEAFLSDLKPCKQFGGSSIKSKLQKPTGGKLSDKQALTQFFDKVGLTSPTKCMECGAKLNNYTRWAQRCCTAHLLPKGQFKTIATNKDNILFLGASLVSECGHHGDYDNKDSEYRASMKIYPLVLERFGRLKPLLTDKELIRAYTYLNIKWQ